MFAQPRFENARMVVARVIEDDHHLPSPPVMSQHLLEERLEALRVELFFTPNDQTPVSCTYCAEHRHAFPSGGMKEDGIHYFWRYPHNATRAMLLEMAFVLKPHLKVFASGEAQEFFYIGVGLGGQHER